MTKKDLKHRLKLDAKGFIKEHIKEVEFRLRPYTPDLEGLEGKRMLVDLYMSYALTFKDEDTEEMLSLFIGKELSLDKERLYDSAMENLEKRLRCLPLDTAVSLFTGEIFPSVTKGMVLTNAEGYWGANQMLNRKALEGVAEIMDSDVYIIPSSVHEVILIPSRPFNASEIHKTIREVNRNTLGFGDFLSDHLYVYDREIDELDIALF